MWGGFVLVGALVLGTALAPATPIAAAACGLPGAPTSTAYLPNITKTLGGPDGWVTPFIVQNVGTAATTLEVSFYRFGDGSLVTCRTVTGLQPGTSFADVPNSDADLPDGSQFSVVVRSFGSEIVAVVNEHQGVGARAESLSYVGLTAGATTVGLPWVANQHLGWLTTFIIQNLGASQADVAVAFAEHSGTRTASLTYQIQPGRSVAVNPADEPSLPEGTSYSAVVTSNQPVGVVANAHNDAPDAAQPMAFSYNGTALGSGDVAVPWVGRNADGGRTTTVVIQNLGTGDAQPHLSFRAIGSGVQVTVQLGTVGPGRSVSYTLPPPSAACPAGGSAGCPAEGEHSLVVAGGPFGVLTYMLGLGAAMGVTGGTATSTRNYLPNVTRTLGGPSGWTTPVVVQSAGATTATLRWYRFSDGTLDITQYVGGLTTGASVKVDPRSVPELDDGKQYSVVVDGNGPVHSLVLELSAAGGDGAMAYEGFAAAAVLTPAPTVSSLALSPATVSLTYGKTQTLSVVARDQAGFQVIGVPVTWTVEPANLGMVTASGEFTAAAVSGTGTVRATFGSLAATSAITVSAETVTQGGLNFVVRLTQRADVFVETTVSTSDADTVVSVIDGDVTQVETTYARSFATRPKVYLFASTESYTVGLEAIFLLTREDAIKSGGSSDGLFSHSSPDKVAGKWSGMRGVLPITVFRHELVHMMVRQIAKPTTAKLVPAWFNEGNARLEEFTAVGARWMEMRDRYTAASMAYIGAALSVSDLTDQRVWNDRSGDIEWAQYAQASQLARFVREVVGGAGNVRILELMGDGHQFESAYATVAGRPLAEFSASAIGRLQAIAPAYPGIATAPDEPTGRAGLTYALFGFPSQAVVNLDIVGQGLRYRNTLKTRTTNSFGVSLTYFGLGWPNDSYSITATYGVTTVTVAAPLVSGSFAEVHLAA